MKTTLDIPDVLYRKVKAKSAMEGYSMRGITILLYTQWSEAGSEKSKAEIDNSVPSWFASASPFIDHSVSHDMDSIRASIAAGRRGERAK